MSTNIIFKGLKHFCSIVQIKAAQHVDSIQIFYTNIPKSEKFKNLILEEEHCYTEPHIHVAVPLALSAQQPDATHTKRELLLLLFIHSFT